MCTWGTLATDALGLKHQDFGIHSACPLTQKQLETHECVLKIVATDTDALVLKHQATSIQNTWWMIIVSDQFYAKNNTLKWNNIRE